jgi:hypothetical protein
MLWVELFGALSFKEGIPIILKIGFGLCGSAQANIFTLVASFPSWRWHAHELVPMVGRKNDPMEIFP